MTLGASLAVVGSLNLFAVTVWALSGFGNGMIYQIGFHTCSRLSDKYCDGTVATAVAHITIAATLIFPIQMVYLMKYTDWQLVLHLVISQVLGLVCGMYLLMILDAVLTARLLGAVMCVAALQRFSAEFELHNPSLHHNHSSSSPDNSSIHNITMSPLDSSKHGLASSSNTVISTRNETPPTTKYQFENWQDYLYVWFIGISAGVFGGLYAAGGPPLLYFVASTNMEKNACRASMALLFTVENLERWLFLWLSHNTKVMDPTAPSFIPYTIVLNITALLGMLIGNMMMDKVSQKLFRRIIDIILTMGSLMLATTDCTEIETVLVVLALLCVYAGMYVYLHRKLDQHRLDMESLRNNMNIVDSFTFVHEDDDDDLMTIEFNRSPQQSPRNSPGRSAIEMVQKTITSIGKAAKSTASSAASSTSGSRNGKNGNNGHQRQHEYSKLNMDDDDT
jgi:uncharacterized membrane protein YfcA